MALIRWNLILWCHSARWFSSLWLLDVLRWELREFLAITVWWSWHRTALRSRLLLIFTFIRCLLNLFHPCTATSWMWLSWIHTRVAFTLQQQILLSLTLNHTIFSTLWMRYLLSTLWNDIIIINRGFYRVFIGNRYLRRCVYVLLRYVGHCKTLFITRSRSLIILILVQNYLLMTLFCQNDIFLITFQSTHSIETFTSCFQNWVNIFAHLNRFFGVQIVILLFGDLFFVQ